jgi:hypothetical protein
MKLRRRGLVDDTPLEASSWRDPVRRGRGGQPTVRFTFAIPTAQLAVMDAYRGEFSRAAFIRRAIQAAIHEELRRRGRGH